MIRFLFFFSLALVAFGQVVPDTPGFQIEDVSEYELIAKSGSSAVYRMTVVNSTGADSYNDRPYLVRLVGDRETMGHDYATLVGDEVNDAYNAVLQKSGINFAQKALLDQFLDTQWIYLSQQVPSQYLEELEGIKKVSHSVYKTVTRVIVIANLPSDLPQDLQPILNDEANQNGAQEELDHMWRSFKAAQCSMMAVWGSRTVDQQLFSCRNLDYAPNLGVNPWKSVIVFIPDGAIPHVAFGFLPLYGVLSGMSKAGITVHEANLEEKNETFLGFPWVLRLRYIMENGNDLSSALELWGETNNTIGYNHMIAFQDPSGQYNRRSAVALETAAHYTAYFEDMDEREQTCLVNGRNVGAPLPEALFRTNHPYDPALMADYLWWNFTAYQDSQNRYMLASNTIAEYEASHTVMDILQAINLTSTVGQKGHKYPHQCVFPYATEHGENILSVTHQPLKQLSYVAWDNGADDTWSPAACNTYVKVDLSLWW